MCQCTRAMHSCPGAEPRSSIVGAPRARSALRILVGQGKSEDPWWIRCMGKATDREVPDEEPLDGDTGDEDDAWLTRKACALRRCVDGRGRLGDHIRQRRARRQARTPGPPALPPPPTPPEEADGPTEEPGAKRRVVGAPAGCRPVRGEAWGIGGRFILAPVYARGKLTSMSATCCLHLADGERCNSSLSLGQVFSLEQACHRIKQWCVRGLDITDGLGSRERHLAIKPRVY